MKIICCDLCDDVIKLNLHWQCCKCENICGRYLKDGRTAEIEISQDQNKCRVIGVPNGIRYGLKKEMNAWVFQWDNEWLKVKASVAE